MTADNYKSLNRRLFMGGAAALASAVTLPAFGQTSDSTEILPSAGGAVRNATTRGVRSALPLTLDACGANSPLVSTVGANPSTLVLVAFGAGASASGGMRWVEIY
jgi:hypothetical protein